MRGETICDKYQEHLIPELTFRDISPIWAARLDVQRNFPVFMSFTWLKWYWELRYTSKCVVGEAYGHSSAYVYSCDECNSIGCKFMYYFMLNWRRKLEENIQTFVKHWDEKHRQEQQRKTN